MLVGYNKKNYTKFSDDEKAQVIVYLDILSELKEFSYLKKFDYERVKFYWHHKMNVDNGILGAFSMLHPNTIFLMYCPSVIDILMSTITHELLHMYQFKYKYTPLVYILLQLPIIRNFIIEPEADRLTILADIAMDKIVKDDRFNK